MRVIDNEKRKTILKIAAGISSVLLAPHIHGACTHPNCYDNSQDDVGHAPDPSKPISTSKHSTSGKHRENFFDGLACNFSQNAIPSGNNPNKSLEGSSGIQELDFGLIRELPFFKSYFGVNPAVFFINEGSDENANAYATPANEGKTIFPDGTVVIGKYLINKEKRKIEVTKGDWSHVVAAIVAHEFGHIAQYKNYQLIQGFPKGKYMELHADLLAGWYTQIRQIQLAPYGIGIDIYSTMKEFFDIGDYQFNSPSHHGTPDERLTFLKYGLNFGSQNMSFREAFIKGLNLVKSV